MADNKTASYTRRAIDKYNQKFDRVTANLPKGTKERIKAVAGDISAGAFVVSATLAELERLEAKQEK